MGVRVDFLLLRWVVSRQLDQRQESILGQDLNLVLLPDLGPQSVSCNHTLIQHSLLIAAHYHTKQNNKHKGYSRDEGNDMGIDSIIRKHVKERRLGT